MGLCRAVEIFWKKDDVWIVVTEMDSTTKTYIASANPSLVDPGRIWFGTIHDYERDLRHGMGS